MSLRMTRAMSSFEIARTFGSYIRSRPDKHPSLPKGPEMFQTMRANRPAVHPYLVYAYSFIIFPVSAHLKKFTRYTLLEYVQWRDPDGRYGSGHSLHSSAMRVVDDLAEIQFFNSAASPSSPSTQEKSRTLACEFLIDR